MVSNKINSHSTVEKPCDCTHTHSENTKMTCSCKHEPKHTSEATGCECGCGHRIPDKSTSEGKAFYWAMGISALLLTLALAFDHLFNPSWFVVEVIGHKDVRFIWYLLAFMPVAWRIFKEAVHLIFLKGDFFNEVVLIAVATVGAFAIGEYPEAIMLMLLYSIGEILEELASTRAHHSISALIDVRPNVVKRLTNQGEEEIAPSECRVGERIYMLPGERVALDGELASEEGTFDLSALTGESLPVDLEKGESVSAGAIVQSRPVEMLVTKPYGESTLARILEMVENASERKPRTEHFIRRFARYYTPIVFGLAVLIVFLPYIWSLFNPSFSYNFSKHFYNGLIFLVTSCPCALIISVPLCFYSGIGAASRYGLLFKGSLFLEKLRNVKAFIFDKTGTLSEGNFEVIAMIEVEKGIDAIALQALTHALEQQSTHPIARAVFRHIESKGIVAASILEIEEISGMGMHGKNQDGKQILVGNTKLFSRFGVTTDSMPVLGAGETAIHMAFDGRHVLTFLLSDQLKPSAADTIKQLKKRGLYTAIFSGDQKEIVEAMGLKLGVDEAIGGLLPQDKISNAERLVKSYNKVAFVGDGLNDAPVMALSDVGFAMGGIGTDAAIEAADVVIQSDDPLKTVIAVDIAHRTRTIVLANIALALGVKAIVMLLAVFSLGNLVLAIIADVGITLIAIVNAVRLLGYKSKLKN